MEFKDVQQIPINVQEAIKKRISVRTFEEKALTEADKTKLMSFWQTLTNPFGVEVCVHYLSKESGIDKVKLGTYGMIKGAKDFLAVTVKEAPFAMEAIGYQFENLVLYATDMGLGTVWLGGSYNKKDFERAMEIPDDVIFPCVCPVGYSLGKKSIIEKITTTIIGARKRKPWEQIFFASDFEHSLDAAGAGDYCHALEMLRLAPSATNAQPWAVVKERNNFHFFNHYKKNTGEDMIKIKRLDMGIALAHFHQTAMSEGLAGHFAITDIHFPVPEDMHYVLSYQCE